MIVLKKIFIFFSVFITMFFSVAVPVFGATFTFTKDAENPTVNLGGIGAWDNGALFDPNVYKDSGDGLYKMYYLAWNTSYVSGIGYATSSDSIHWSKYPGNPVLTGTPGTYDADLWEAEVQRDGDIFKMWYQGSGSGGASYQSHYATSSDGIHWNKYPGNPVFSGGAGKWDQDYTGIRSVIKLNGIYYAWYEGSKLSGSWGKFSVGFATSSDGIHWNKYSVDAPVLQGDIGQWDNEHLVPSVIRVGNLFVMFYSTRETTGKIGVATSLDGIHWTKYPNNPVFNLLGGAGAWDQYAATTIISTIQYSTSPSVFRIYYRGQDAATLRSGGLTAEVNLPNTPTNLSEYKSNGTTLIFAGGATNETSVVLKFDMTSAATDLLTPQVEVRESGVAFTGEPTHSGTATTYTTSSVATTSITITGLENGKSYHWQAITNNAGGNATSSSGLSTDFSVDTVAPSAPAVSIAGNNLVTYSESGAVHAAGTAEANSVVAVTLSDAFGAHTSYTTGTATGGIFDFVFNIASFNDGTITASSTATDSAGNISAATITTAEKNIFIPDVTTDSIDVLNGTTAVFHGNVSLSNGSDVTDYGFKYGATTGYGESVSAGSGLGAFSKTVSAFSCGQNYHFRSYATNASGTSYGNDMLFQSGSCSSPGNVSSNAPRVPFNWVVVTEILGEPQTVALHFNVSRAEQFIVSEKHDFSGASWQPFQNDVRQFVGDRSKEKTLFFRFRSGQYGGETDIYPLIISAKAEQSAYFDKKASSTDKNVFLRTLAFGSRGDDVKLLQELLKKIGFMPANITTVRNYGFATQRAVKALQKAYDKPPYNKKYNLKPYPGVVGPNTLRLLNEVIVK